MIRPDGIAPYAPPKAVLNVLEQWRAKHVPTPITLDVLMKLGITESLAPRTHQALRLLDWMELSRSKYYQ